MSNGFKRAGLAAVALGIGFSSQSVGFASAAPCEANQYLVNTTSVIYDSWTSQSKPVGTAYRGNGVISFSAGSEYVRVDRLYRNEFVTTEYKTDYIAKKYLTYQGCVSGDW